MFKKLILGFSFALLPAYVCGKDTAPDWVREISTRAVPSYPGKVPITVLLEEQHVTVDGTGRITISVRKAIKILNQEGRKEAYAVIPYFATSSKVKELHAWLVAPNGFTKTYGKDRVEDVGAVGEDLYNEVRFRMVHADEPEIGAVFAYEAESETKTLFTQDDYYFQNDFPAVQSRYILTLPAGWSAKGVVLNHAPIQPEVDGSTYRWELGDLPFRELESKGPSIGALTPRLCVSFFPPANAGDSSGRAIKTWRDASEWLTELAAGQDALTPEMSAKVRELTASAKNEYEKLQAIARYVQGVKYVSIQMNLARGGGYKPHAAQVVFEKQYGDCKDKANLMRALLKAAGIQSYLVVLYSGDRTFVREEWPSPQQFNHAIIAVRVSQDENASTVIQDPALGRLLIFDPTSTRTPIGDLPGYEQGSFALLLAGNKGSLLRLPVTPPDSNLTDIAVEGSLSEAGDLKAEMTENNHGQPAADLRGIFSSQTRDGGQKFVEHWLSYTGRTTQVEKIEPRDAFAQDEFKLRVEFASSNYAQLMQGRLLIFKPAVVVPTEEITLHNEKRHAPIVLNAETFRKQIRIKLPSNFSVDELPDGGKLATPFAQFVSTYKVTAGELLVNQELKTEAVTLPATDYPEVRKFFGTVQGMEEQPVVLVRN